MPNGAVRRFRRMVTGLLVLVGLLLSGAQGPAAAALPLTSPHHDRPQVQTVDMAHPGLATPSGDQHVDHGLACCLSGQCTVQPVWFADTSAGFLDRLVLAVGYMPSVDRWSSGIGAAPTPPPPRSAV
jgi:hypothetical protein